MILYIGVALALMALDSTITGLVHPEYPDLPGWGKGLFFIARVGVFMLAAICIRAWWRS